MWHKITNTFSRSGRGDLTSDASSSVNNPNVMNNVLEQHPNLSNFQDSNATPFPTDAEPPPSPSKSRGSFFKRLTKTNVPFNDDSINARPSSPFSISQPQKVRAPIPSKMTADSSTSQGSISRASVDGRRRSFDALRRSQDGPRDKALSPSSRRPSLELLRGRPSLNALKTKSTPAEAVFLEEDESSPFYAPVPIIDTAGAASVRSILREPNTPGTGQSVRFFSRQAQEAFSPDPSMESEELLSHQNSQPKGSLFGRLEEAAAQEPVSPAIAPPRKSSLSISRSPKPALAEIFSPMQEGAQQSLNSLHSAQAGGSGMLTQVSSPDVSLDMSQEIDIPAIPPGLNSQDQQAVLNVPDFTTSNESPAPLSSTPFREANRLKLRPKQIHPVLKEEIDEDVGRPSIDENIFHARERNSLLPGPPAHDRSQSFNLGQTVFFSADHSETSNRSSISSVVPSLATDSRNSRVSQSTTDSPVSASSLRSRSRALSDTVFHSMLMRSTSSQKEKDSPENDINDVQSPGVVVDSRGQPDPFRADANTYYGPQTMIPVTPPKSNNHVFTSPIRHMRTSSKEENIIASLQTQLTLQSDLCSQYETDLHARDELVELLSKRLADVEQEESRRKGIVRAWKKKVAELEKACRYLEEEVDNSRQESMERSIMDEASGEALRMLHRQISNFDHERDGWRKTEDELHDRLAELERVAEAREAEVRQLKETIWSREENEREFKTGIESINENLEMMGNVSLGFADQEEVTRIVQESAQQVEDERQRYRSAELEWGIQRDELVVRAEKIESEKVSLADELESVQAQLREKDEELNVLKGELEAQWKHTETNSEKTNSLENERRELEKEVEMLRTQAQELDEKVVAFESDYAESENRRDQLEQELTSLDENYESLMKERDELAEHLQGEREAVESLENTVQERDTQIRDLEKEFQYAQDRVETLQSSLNSRDSETTSYAERIRQSEEEVETLREQLSKMERQHTHAMDEKIRALQEASTQSGVAKQEMEDALRQRTEADVELRTIRDRVAALKEEVERLRRQVHDLQQDSADKDMRLVQMNKQHAQDKEDIQGLNIALDAKQQELELIKRKLGTKGTAGSTPAPASRTGTHVRRESSASAFATPSFSRPSSSMSNTSNTSETPSRSTALAKSSRMNTSASATPTARKIGSMGPPAATKPRASIATPTPAPRPTASNLARSTSGKPVSSVSTGTPIRRTSSEQSASINKLKSVRPTPASTPIKEGKEEKENLQNSTSTPSTGSVKRRSMIPASAS